MTIILIVILLIEVIHQRYLAKYYKHKYSNELHQHNETADELHHLKVKYGIIPITCWEM